MQKINVPILGVTDGSEARAVRDGECCVLHNLTVDKGGTRVIAPPSVASATNVKDYNEYYHTKAEQWLSVENGSVYNSKRVRINHFFIKSVFVSIILKLLRYTPCCYSFAITV